MLAPIRLGYMAQQLLHPSSVLAAVSPHPADDTVSSCLQLLLLLLLSLLLLPMACLIR
jgi:hypothetical protein